MLFPGGLRQRSCPPPVHGTTAEPKRSAPQAELLRMAMASSLAEVEVEQTRVKVRVEWGRVN